jgi:MoaA/NifB/PqqE/SkfB family radical SAM enzyme
MADERQPRLAIATIDFHVTTECSQECPYCWGPQGLARVVDTETAQRIIARVKDVGASRIVFTGGDPVQRVDLGELLLHAKTCGLEVALSTTGDALTPEFLATVSPALDLISLPLDGPNEEINARTKKPGHFAAIQRVLEWLRAYPAIDVKLCTPVTRHNLAHVPVILDLAEAYAQTTRARVFYNVFQAFPRAMFEADWAQLLVTDAEFAALEEQLANRTTIRVNFLSHATLDRLYVMIFPDGSLVIPRRSDYLTYGPFLAVDDLEAALAASQFDTAKHLKHAQGWRRLEGGNDLSR